MLMVVVRQVTSWMAQASMYYVVKETSVCWVMYISNNGFDFAYRRIHYDQLPAEQTSSYSSLPCFLPAQKRALVYI